MELLARRPAGRRRVEWTAWQAKAVCSVRTAFACQAVRSIHRATRGASSDVTTSPSVSPFLRLIPLPPSPPTASTTDSQPCDTNPAVPGSRFLLAVAVSAAVVLSSPFIRDIRDLIRAAFPGKYALIVGAAVSLAIGLAVLTAIVKIRDRRGLRYGAIALALVAGNGLRGVERAGNRRSRRRRARAFRRVTASSRCCSIAPGGRAPTSPCSSCRCWPVSPLARWKSGCNGLSLGVSATYATSSSTASRLPAVSSSAPASTHRARWGFRCGPVRSAASATRRPSSASSLAAFFHSVHLGVEIQDDETGRFRSRYTVDDLARIGQDRLALWKEHPPLERPRSRSREDQYMSEALLHVTERNRKWEAADMRAAWAENRILEKYYAPALDAPSYMSKTGHRWPDPQRNDARQRLGERQATVAAYESRADATEGHHFVRVWSPAWFWAGVLVGSGRHRRSLRPARPVTRERRSR